MLQVLRVGRSLLGSSSHGADTQPSGGWGRAEACPASTPNPSSFSPNELGTFHCQLLPGCYHSSWPERIGRPDWGSQGILWTFSYRLKEEEEEKGLYSKGLIVWINSFSLLNQIEDYFIITVCNQNLYGIFRYIPLFYTFWTCSV